MAVMALAKVFEQIAGPEAPVEFHAYDGSEAGVAGAPVRITIRSPVALSYIAQAPGSLPREPHDLTNLPPLSNLAMRALPNPSAI